MKKTIINILILIAIINTALYGQQLHRMGLLFEDVSKNPRIKKAEPKAVLYKLASSVDLSVNMPPVGDQGTQNCCVAWAFGYYYKTYQEWQDYGWSVTDPNHIFSPAFIYNHINGGQDSGSYFSDAMTLLTENGCATIAEFPYNDTSCTIWPSESVYRHAINYRSDSAYYIQTNYTTGIDQVKQLLADGNIAVLGIYVYNNLENINNYKNTYCLADAKGSILGGHALTFVGYDDNMATADGTGAFKMINQWGTEWGDSGYCWMSYQAVMSKLSQGYAYYLSDRGQYSPTIIASTQITHPNTNLLNLGFGIGLNSAPKFSIQFFNFTMNTQQGLPARPFPNNKIDFDLSDGLSYINTTQSNNVFVSAKSTISGTVDNFSVTDLRVPNTTTSTLTPIVIPNNDAIVYTNLNLNIVLNNNLAIVQQASPFNGSVGIVQPVQLNWMSSAGASSYRLRLSADSNFESVILDTLGLINTTFSVSGLSNLTTYYWLVNAVNSGGMSPSSQVWNFKTFGVVLVYPPNNGINVPVNVNFQWNESQDQLAMAKMKAFLKNAKSLANAGSSANAFMKNPKSITNSGSSVKKNVAGVSPYWFQLTTDTTSTEYVVNDSTLTDSTMLVNGLQNLTHYWWRVNAMNGTGWTYTNWSKFTTISTVPPAETILQWDNTEPIGYYAWTPNDTICVAFNAVAGGRLDSIRVALSKAGTITGGIWTYTGYSSAPLGNLKVPITASISTTPASPYPIPYNNWAKVDLSSYNISTDNAFAVGFVIGSDPTTPGVMVTNYPGQVAYHSYTYLQIADSNVNTPGWYYITSSDTTVGIYLIRAYVSLITGVKQGMELTPKTFSLSQNYPNPFNPSTMINYSIPKASLVAIKVYDVLGREVKTLVNEEKSAGNYSVQFSANSGYASGVYFYRMQAGNFVQTKKLLLLK